MPRRSSASRTAGWSSAGKRRRPRLARGLAGEKRELVAGEEVVPERGRAHHAIEASPLVHEDDSRRVDPCQVRVGRRHDGVESPHRLGRDVLVRRSCAGQLPLDDDDVPAGEVEHRRMDPREPELEHAAWPISKQLEDPRSRGGGESWRHPVPCQEANVRAPGCRNERLRSHPPNLIRVMPAKGAD